MELEVVEGLATDQVAAGTGVGKHAIDHAPVCSRRLPTRQVRPVEESDRRSPTWRRRASQRRRPLRGPDVALAGRIRQRARQLIPYERDRNVHIDIALYPLLAT